MYYSKIALIFGVDDEKRNIRDGKLEEYGDIKDPDTFHAICLKIKGVEKYPECAVFENATFRTSPSLLSYVYAHFGNIVFLNTSENDSSYGRKGLVFIPENITENQKNTLKGMASSIGNFDLEFWCELKNNQGIIDSEIICSNNKQEYNEIIENINKKTNEGTKRK